MHLGILNRKMGKVLCTRASNEMGIAIVLFEKIGTVFIAVRREACSDEKKFMLVVMCASNAYQESLSLRLYTSMLYVYSVHCFAHTSTRVPFRMCGF